MAIILISVLVLRYSAQKEISRLKDDLSTVNAEKTQLEEEVILFIVIIIVIIIITMIMIMIIMIMIIMIVISLLHYSYCYYYCYCCYDEAHSSSFVSFSW